MEEQKVAALVTGSKINQKHLKADPQGLRQLRRLGRRLLHRRRRTRRSSARSSSRAASMVPDNFIKRVIQFAKQGYKDINFPTYDTDWDSEAYLTVAGQNSNNSVRVTDGFLKAVEADGKWDLTYRKNGKVAKTLDARASVGKDRLRRLGLGRSGPAIPHHDQRLAHLPGLGRDPRQQSVLGIHVPRRHRLQSRLVEPAHLPRRENRQIQRRMLRARGAAVDRRSRNLGDDGAIPVEADCRTLLRIPHARPRLRQYRRPADDLRHSL